MDSTDAPQSPESHWRERQFADAQALAHVGSWERGLTDHRSVWSDELCRIFGQPLGFSPTFDEFVQLIHPDDRDRVAGDLGRATSGDLYESWYRILRPDGEIRHVHGRAGGRVGDRGRIAYTLGTIQDVTKQHDAEVARREAQDLFETAFSHAPIGMGLIAPDGRCLKVNPAMCLITGWPESELIQRPFADITHPEDIDADRELLALLAAGEIRGYQFEKRYIRRGGAEIWAELSVSLVRDAAGAPRHFIVQVEDISERKEAQRRLLEAEAEARAERDHATAIISAMGEGYALTLDGEIKAVNEALCTVTGFSAAELIGARPPYPFWPPEHREAIADDPRRRGPQQRRNPRGDHDAGQRRALRG